MNIATSTRGSVHLIQPAGELDDETAERLVEAVSERISPNGRIVIGLANVEHVNSAGLSALVNVTAQANVQECRVILAAPSPAVAGVLEITKLTRFFEMAGSVDEAVQRFGA